MRYGFKTSKRRAVSRFAFRTQLLSTPGRAGERPRAVVIGFGLCESANSFWNRNSALLSIEM
jgi:hypothetical protein